MSKVRNINQQLIADQLNISVGTVSKALRDYPDIGLKTRNAVRNLAKEVGYNPNSVAGKNRFVGVLCILVEGESEYSHDEIINGYLAGISHLAGKLNISIVIHFCGMEECEAILKKSNQPTAMRHGLLSGLILLRSWPDNVAGELSKLLPCVSIVNKTHNTNIDVIGIDNFGGIDILVEHLYGLGHTKIGFLGKCIEISWSLERYAGYVAAMARHNLDFEKDWVVEIDLKNAKCKPNDILNRIDFSKIETLWKSGITAFVCSNNSCADALWKWCGENGISVPDDISITGFHGGFTSSSYNDLTCVTFDNSKIGDTALRTLEHKMMHTDETAKEIVFPASFVQGQSTYPPQKR